VTDLAQIFDHFSAVLNNSTLFIPSTPPVPQIIIDTVRQPPRLSGRASLVLQPAPRQLRSAMRPQLRAACARALADCTLCQAREQQIRAAAPLPAMVHARAQHDAAARRTHAPPLLCDAGRSCSAGRARAGRRDAHVAGCM